MSVSEGKCIYALRTILTNNNGDEKGVELIYNYLTEQLTKEIKDYREEKITKMEKMLKRNEYIDNFLNDKDIKYYSFYNNSLDTEVFIKYDGYSYEYAKRDDIYHKIIQDLNPPSILSNMKREIADEIINLIVGEQIFFHSLPESSTIQNLINFFCPAFFETKEELKYFLTILGDCILNKNTDLVFYVPELSREFLMTINLFYNDYFGSDINFSMFKFKYRGHDYEHSMIIPIKKTITSMTFLSEYIKKNIFNVCVVACHYSKRYKDGQNYLTKQNKKMKDKVLYLTKRNKGNIVHEFLRTKTKTMMNSSISQNDMYFLWKMFCDSKDMPLIMYKQTFIDQLKELLSYKNNMYENITSEYLKPAINFKKFWEESIQFYDIEKEENMLIEDEYEMSELGELYNIWLQEEKNTKLNILITEKDMKELILYFYPKIEIKDKVIQNIYCSYWNKQEDIRESIDAKFDKDINENISLVQAYLSYVSYSDKHQKINCCSKKYFEKYIKNIIPSDYIKNKSILKKYWD